MLHKLTSWEREYFELSDAQKANFEKLAKHAEEQTKLLRAAGKKAVAE